MDDSAAEADPEPKSPGGGSSSEGVNGAASAAKGAANSRKDGSKTHRSESASPGRGVAAASLCLTIACGVSTATSRHVV